MSCGASGSQWLNHLGTRTAIYVTNLWNKSEPGRFVFIENWMRSTSLTLKGAYDALRGAWTVHRRRSRRTVHIPSPFA